MNCNNDTKEWKELYNNNSYNAASDLQNQLYMGHLVLFAIRKSDTDEKHLPKAKRD
jgi:hypothetical protein